MDILITEELAPGVADGLVARYDVVYDGGLWRDCNGLKRAIAEARTVLVRNQTQLTAEVLGAAKKLRAIGRLGVGLDNIDMDTARGRGIVVVAAMNANATSVAELTMGLILALARKIPQADRSTKEGGWDRKGGMGIELDGRSLGICGFGRIGRLVAQRARAFGMRLMVFDPYADPAGLIEPRVIRCESKEELFANGDFVTLHLPLSAGTQGFAGETELALMKEGSFLINTSRGGVVDEAALLRALRSGRLAGAALDVRDVEPPSVRIGLEDFSNVILTPHLGAATVEAQRRTFETVSADIERVLRGEPTVSHVDFAR